MREENLVRAEGCDRADTGRGYVTEVARSVPHTMTSGHKLPDLLRIASPVARHGRARREFAATRHGPAE